MQEKRKQLIKFLISNEGKPTDYTWHDLAEKFNVRNNKSQIDGRKANDYWRWYLKYGSDRGELAPNSDESFKIVNQDSNSSSQWAHLDDLIAETIQENYELGYTELSKLVLPEGSYRDYNLLRTYIRRNFGILREALLGKSSKVSPPKILIYDLETSRVPARLWWTGKQYVNYKQLKGEPKIITVAWKWLGSDKVEYLTWDSNQSDEKLVREFCKIYNSADQVVGVNNDRFDNRWLAARAAKFNISMSPYIKSFDILKKAKSVFRIPSYSMDYMTKYFGVANKLQHEGLVMWDKVELGNKKEREEGLKAMVEYNIGDIIATEDLYLILRKYMKGVSHFGTLRGTEKYTCPECGGSNLELVRTMTTAAGTIQRVMKCVDDGVTFKISNTQYNKFKDFKEEEFNM